MLGSSLIMKKEVEVEAGHEHVRVGIFVDALNILYSFRDHAAKKGIGRVIDFRKVYRECARGRRVVMAVAYSGSNNYEGKKAFVGLNGALCLAGFELKMKQADILADRRMKCNWDVGMAIDIPKVAKKIEVAVLVTGDGDFTDLVTELQNEYGCEVEIVAFRDSMSLELKRVANRYTYLEDGDYLKDVPELKTNKKYSAKEEVMEIAPQVASAIVIGGSDSEVPNSIAETGGSMYDGQIMQEGSKRRKISLKRTTSFYAKRNGGPSG